jgi:hypothetical protein
MGGSEMKQSREAYVQVAGYINRQLQKEVRLHRDKTNNKSLDQAKVDADSALMWLGVLAKLADTQAVVEQPTMFDTAEFIATPVERMTSY